MRRFVFILPFLLMFCGCEKLNDAQKSGLSLAALTAKERAAAFDVIKGQLRPAKAEHALLLQRYVDAHARQLNAQSIALADLVKSVQAGSILSDAARKALGEESRTAVSRARNFELTMPDIDASDSGVAQFLSAHLAALNGQAASLTELSKLIPPKPPKVEKP